MKDQFEFEIGYLTLIRLGFLMAVFSKGGGGGGVNLTTLLPHLKYVES